MSFLFNAGFFAWPMLLLSLLCAVGVGRCLHKPSDAGRLRLICTGLTTFLVGLLGTLVGLQMAASAVSGADTTIVFQLWMKGIEIALIPVVWGTLVAALTTAAAALSGFQASRAAVAFPQGSGLPDPEH